MSVWRMILREIAHRKGNFLLGLLAVGVATGCLVGSEWLLRGDELQTRTILAHKRQQIETAVAAKQTAVEAAGDELQDAIRKHMTKLGFNILIVPAEQDLAELHLNGTLTQTMPESYVEKLAASNIVTVNHLLPSVTKRIHWPERDLDVILYGTRGEVPIMHRSQKKPLLEAVAAGQMVVGHAIHQELGLSVGDRVVLMDKEFTISTLHPERGSADDVTVWIDLAEAQQLLGLENLVHAILALECECAGDRISQIREEIAGILPGTQVVERFSQALARAEARSKAKAAAEQALAAEKASGAETLAREEQTRRELEERRAGLAAVLVPLVIGASAVWIALLAFLNVRQRSDEIGILRAIGLRSSQVLVLFLGKAMLIGALGGLLGVGGGVLVGAWLGNLSNSESSLDQVLSAVSATLILAPLLAPLLAATASWLPALSASRRDPATLLQAE